MGKKSNSSQPSITTPCSSVSECVVPENQNQNHSAGSARIVQGPTAHRVVGEHGKAKPAK